jgi:hypothetical protein
LTAFIDHHQVEQVQSQNPTYNFPATGQLLVGLMGAQTGVISSMTASNSFSCSPGINNTGAGVTAQVAYCTGTAATASQTISPAFNTTPGPTPAGVELSLTSVSNFPNATVDVQSDGTGDQTTPTAFNTNPPISLTPSQENDVMFMTASVYWHTLMSTQTDANGHTPTFLAASMSKGDDAPTGCTTGTPNSTLDEDNAYGFYQNTSDTTAVSFEFGGSQTSGGCTTNPSGVSSWGAAAIAFKSGTVVNLSACDSTTVQNALNAISADNTTINLPAATCPNYTTPVSVTTPYSFTLAGKSTVATTNAQGNPATFTDSTIITDAQGNPAITLIGSGSASQAIRMTGITFAAPTTATYNGVVKLQSTSSTPGTLRLDHSHFVNIDDLAVEMDEPVKTALADHNMVDVPSGDDYNGIRVYNKGGDGYGDTAWANGAAWGTAAGVFIENNTFNYGFMNDCALGGYYIARYNTFNIPTGNINIGIQSHGVGSQPQNQRGCLGWEVYQNTVGGGGTISASLEFQTSGTGFVWGNNIPSANVATGSHDVVLNYNRVNANTYAQVATPNGWGYCGTAYNGTGSCWDGGGAFASNGYPCLDQLGRGGPSNLLSGTFPTLVNTSTSSCSWPNELLKPVYIFDEGFGGSASIVSVSNGQINPNVDYYSPATSFTGATGTGYGLYSAIPTTCTAGVGYWATDQTTLYTCGAGNVWSSYYTPYTYPHPLDH